MDVPIFPSLRPLTIEDKPLFGEAFRINPPLISEFTFTNLYAWREPYNLKISSLDSALILRSDKSGLIRFFYPIGSSDVKAVIEKISRDVALCVFIRIPQSTATLLENDSRFKIEPDRDNFDYLYLAQDLISLTGRKYDGKRNLIKKFKAANIYEYLNLDPANIEECLKFEEEWCAVKKCDETEGLRDERMAINQILENFSLFNLLGGAIRVGGRICAVCVAEKLNPDTLVMHILKANPDITGLYQTITQEFMMRNAIGFKYINFEQDLGVAGLRKSKLSYQPAEMIKKYTISLKNEFISRRYFSRKWIS